MGKLRPEFTIQSYGLYTAWDKDSKTLPKVLKHTWDIPAEIGVEFGLILSVKRAKGEVLEYSIEHPPFRNKFDEIEPPFEGSYFVNSNDFQFFLGDTIWAPVEDKWGIWTLSVSFKGKEVVRKSFRILQDI